VPAPQPDDLTVPCAEGATLRPTVRVLLIDPAGRLLLIKVVAFDGGDPVWFLPGGGLEPGESAEVAARREVAEETGLRACRIGEEVWQRRVVHTIEGVTWDLRERYFLAPVAPFDPVPAGLTPYETANILELRWWTLGELSRTAERLVPQGLAALFAPYLVERPDGDAS
jgi:8-oxo-dGTP pyrophosphatase MutT (NUDIX family)